MLDLTLQGSRIYAGVELKAEEGGGSCSLRVRGGGGEARRRIIRGGRIAPQGGQGWQLPPPRISFWTEVIPGPELYPDPQGLAQTLPLHPPSEAGLGHIYRGNMSWSEQLSSDFKAGHFHMKGWVGQRRGISGFKMQVPRPHSRDSDSVHLSLLPGTLHLTNYPVTLGQWVPVHHCLDAVWMESLVQVKAGPTLPLPCWAWAL